MKPPIRSLKIRTHSPAVAWASAIALLVVTALPASMVTAAIAIDAWLVEPASNSPDAPPTVASAHAQKAAEYTKRSQGI